MIAAALTLLSLLSLSSVLSQACASDDPDEDLGDEDPLAGVVRGAPARSPPQQRALIQIERRGAGGRVRVPPTRLEMRFPIRPDLGVAPYFGLGTQVHRRGAFTLDTDLGITAERVIQMAGPWRSQGAASGTILAMWELGPWLAVGGVGGIEHRWFRQQWRRIADTWMPVAGVRANTTLIGARRWAFVVGVGAVADVGRVRLVRETAEVVDLVPLEGSVSTRLVFGHGRDRRAETP